MVVVRGGFIASSLTVLVTWVSRVFFSLQVLRRSGVVSFLFWSLLGDFFALGVGLGVVLSEVSFSSVLQLISCWGCCSFFFFFPFSFGCPCGVYCIATFTFLSLYIYFLPFKKKNYSYP